MLLLSRNTNFVMLARTVDGLAVLTHHRAADHGHCAANLHNFAVEADCGAFDFQ